MYTKRFPSAVTDHHLNERIRSLTREINQAEAKMVRHTTNLIRINASVLKAVADGMATKDKDVPMAISLSGLLASMSQRETLYELLAEELGDIEGSREFMEKYPPTYAVEERLSL
jgi:hypothetical protein